MGVLNFTAEAEGDEPRAFSNPFDAMSALLDTEGIADVYVNNGGERVHLLHRDKAGSWESA